jgi:hypothetical protein
MIMKVKKKVEIRNVTENHGKNDYKRNGMK